MAAKAAVPIVLFLISGSMHINPPDNFFSIKSGVIKTSFSPPVSTEAKGSLQQAIFMEKVRLAIASGLES